MPAHKLLLPVLVLLSAHAVLPQDEAQQRARKLIRITTKDWHGRHWHEMLPADIDMLDFDSRRQHVDAIVTPAQLAVLQGKNVRYEVLRDDLEEYERQLRAQDYLDHFHDYSKTLDEIRSAAAAYPQLVKVVDIGDGWEKTQGLADRDIWAVKISDNAEQEEEEPEVLIVGLHHAREIITPEIVLDYMNYLLSHYGRDAYVTYLVDHRQIWLVPVLNPDGLDYVFSTHMLWRKNRRRNSNGSFGVDLNRNYGFKWGYDNFGSSPNASSETYRGTAPFSEPETEALRHFVEDHQFRAALSYHSFGDYVIYPWGYVDGPTPDHASFIALADSIVAYNHYKPGTGLQTVGYTVNGASDDWFYGEQATKNKVFSMTPEVGDWFHPDTADIEELIRENRGPNLYITYAVGEEPVVHHQPRPDTVYQIGPQQITARILAPIVLTDTVALAPQTFTLHFNTTGQAPFDAVALQATGNMNEYAGEIPPLGTGKRVYYFISAADEKGRVGHAPRAARAGALYSFYVPVPSAVQEPLEENAVPQSFALRGFPNPFRNRILLEYDLPPHFAGAFTLEILNALGQRVRLLAQNNRAQPGRHRIAWNGLDDSGRPAPAGIYFIRMRGSDFLQTRKTLLVK